MTAPRLSVGEYVAGVVGGDRAVLARAITLVESDREEDRSLAEDLITRLHAVESRAIRVGISGVPGAGKSTLIDALGMHVVGQGKRVAVLAVDPSSTISGGSILGDKTRMPKLSTKDEAFVRPSPSATTLGGVARRTRETMIVCEAAAFDVIIVETVGVGQSETAVADMVDTFVLLALPGSGDELQGIKKGILELADIVSVSKSDGDNVQKANDAKRALELALGMVQRRHPSWEPPVMQTSALTGAGIPELWSAILRHRSTLEQSGDLERDRREQRRRALWHVLEEEVMRALRSDASVRALAAKLEEEVARGVRLPSDAARELVAVFRNPGA
jgi:LAO/AO transport system kinase